MQEVTLTSSSSVRWHRSVRYARTRARVAPARHHHPAIPQAALPIGLKQTSWCRFRCGSEISMITFDLLMQSLAPRLNAAAFDRMIACRASKFALDPLEKRRHPQIRIGPFRESVVHSRHEAATALALRFPKNVAAPTRRRVVFSFLSSSSVSSPSPISFDSSPIVKVLSAPFA